MTTTQELVDVNDTAGVYLDDLVPGDVLFVTTKNTHYALLYLGFGAAKISGNPKACEGSEVVALLGSTWGGRAFPTGFIGVGVPLEFQLPRSRKVIRTTPIRAIRRVRTDVGAWISNAGRYAPSVLIVIERPDRLSGHGTIVIPVQRCCEAREVLDQAQGVRWIFTDVSLPDGNWSTVARYVFERSPRAEVALCSRHFTKSLRREALTRGVRCVKGAAGEVLRRLLHHTWPNFSDVRAVQALMNG